MRWSVYATALTPRQFTRAVNLLTTGYGYVYLAVRAAERDAQASVVIDCLRSAQQHLEEASVLLGRPGSAPPAPGTARDSGRDLASPSWHAHLAARSAGVSSVATLLADAAVNARRSAEAIQQDAEIEHILQRLTATLATLARVLDLALLLALALL